MLPLSPLLLLYISPRLSSSFNICATMLQLLMGCGKIIKVVPNLIQILRFIVESLNNGDKIVIKQ